MPCRAGLSSARRAFSPGRNRARRTQSTRSEDGSLARPRDDLPTGPRQTYTAATRVEDTPNRVAFEVETSAPGYLVLADTWYPGWRATVDGRTVPVLRPTSPSARSPCPRQVSTGYSLTIIPWD